MRTKHYYKKAKWIQDCQCEINYLKTSYLYVGTLSQMECNSLQILIRFIYNSNYI